MNVGVEGGVEAGVGAKEKGVRYNRGSFILHCTEESLRGVGWSTA